MTFKIINSVIVSLMTFSFMVYFITSHPMMIASIVISQCVLMASLISKKFIFSWFGFFIFIIYLGGILMLFSYIISLINSKKAIFWTNKNFYPLLGVLFFMNIFKESKSFSEVTVSKFMKLISSSFSLSSMKLSIFLMLFLLLIMIMVVFLTESSKGMMRKI